MSLIGDDLLETLCNLARSAPVAAICEVGVYRGGSAKWLSKVAIDKGVDLHLYDTFCGMPFDGPFDLNHKAGDFADTSLDLVRGLIPDAHFHVGVFDGSDIPPNVGFVHADADQYESTAAICRSFGPVMEKGGMIVFDDYRGISGCIKAVDEHFPYREILPDGRALVRF